ncbi:MAG TPA: hypothetical protein VM711_10970 [Sphingomicrobium sp.]|nr:hypothetical protein [Sphingomicrobium sp.]
MQVHRFGGLVAVHLNGYTLNGSRAKAETSYLTPADAQAFASALIASAHDVLSQPNFCNSRVGTWEADPENIDKHR